MKGTQLAADVKFFLDYSKWIDEEERAETWQDSVKRVMSMHRNNPKFAEAFKNPRFVELFELTEQAYLEKLILGSNRALQFGGAPIMKHNSKMYNCLASHCDRVRFFEEAMYWLMSGCGVGYSVQYHHIKHLPDVAERKKGTKTFVVQDDIEGWSDAIGVQVASFFTDLSSDENDWRTYSKFADYSGYEIKFDFSLVREKGAKIAGGFKAPGPDGLEQSLKRIETLINSILRDGLNRLDDIDCYDIICHEADAVLSGGVRRSATICVFSKTSTRMMTAKVYPNFSMTKGSQINPQRARSNNSVVLVRGEVTKEEFDAIIENTKQWGEPGFYFVDHRDQVPNPCVEIGMWPIASNGRTGWQGCNLDVANGRMIDTVAKLMRACTALAFLGTLQAAYTDFKYVSKESKMIFDREALLGCGICGWLNNPDLLLDEEIQKNAALHIVSINKETCSYIDTNPAARTTTSKPDGNTGVLLEAASGAGAEEAPHLFRLMQINKESEISKYFEEYHPYLIEESVWSATKADNVLYIPVETKKGSLYKSEINGVKHLEIVKKIQQNWVEYGTNLEACVQPFLRHNVSNTINVKDGEWDEVRDYLYENRQYFSGVSFLGMFGALDYKQAPFTPVRMKEELLESYGDAALFGSGLIVDGLHYFHGDLWTACEAVQNKELKLDGSREQVLLKKDWIRRAKQFARRYCKRDIQKMIYCLKELYLYHKWVQINRELGSKTIDLSKVQLKPTYTNADTLGSAGCVGGACEMPAEYLERFKK